MAGQSEELGDMSVEGVELCARVEEGLARVKRLAAALCELRLDALEQ